MKEIPGYTNLQLIDETLYSVVYRAGRAETGKPVIIKSLKVKNPSPSEIARFRHEYKIISNIDSDGIVRILDIIATEGRFALVLEDFDGISVKEYLKESLSLERFLSIAIRLADILNHLHKYTITHRNINPGGILYNPGTDTLKLSDFGIAAELTGIKEEIYNARVIEEVLPYMSPEQTGRMNCGVDYRTDFYSLGVTFYEMLTDGVPFTAQEPMEIIHAHIAMMPISPEQVKPGIPSVVSDIVMKLLAKTTEERYQSSLGLMTDLLKCRNRLTTAGTVEPFKIGMRDISPKFNIPQLLVGREKELEILFNAFDRASSGELVLLLVSGEPGIGKSALVNEIAKPIAGKSGYFISGKYDQLRRYVPYSAIIQAFQILARQLLSESDDRIRAWKEKLLTALGNNGRIITDIIPEIELIVGRQPDIPELAPMEAQNRFKLVLKRFARIFADKGHPLVLFLDDLQWADSASLDLIQILTLDRDLRFFFLIGAYRDNEVAAHHPFMLAVDAMLTAGVDIATLKIKALEKESVNQLLINFLHCDPEISSPLAAIMHGKTLGNPFFVIQFLKSLYENNFLILDPVTGWQWDAASIKNTQVTDNVVEFMADKLKDLPAASLDLIKICACIGNRFEIETLAAITRQPIDEMLHIIDALVQEGLVTFKSGLYRFHHDRIHEAAYSLLSPERREQIHYQIGNLKLKSTPPDALFKQIYYVVDQLNRCRGLITTPTERNLLEELNLKAGIKAKDSTAYGAAVAYLQAGIDLLPDNAWQADYRLTYTLHREQMECQYLVRNADEAERLFKIILDNAATTLDKGKAYKILVTLYTNMRSPQDAVEMGIRGLHIMGIRVSTNPSMASVLKELILIKLKLRKIPVEKIIDLPLMENEDRIICMDLMVNTGVAAYFLRSNLFAVLRLKQVYIHLTYGHSPVSAISFNGLSIVVQRVLGDYELGYRIGNMALKLNERLDNKKVAGSVFFNFAFFIQHWKRHAKYGILLYRQAYQLCMDSGNFLYMGYSVNAVMDFRLMIGDRLDDILEEAEKYREVMKQIKAPFARYRESIQMIKILKGLTQDRFSLSGQGFDEEKYMAGQRKGKNMIGLCFTLLFKAKLFYLFGKYEEARKSAAELDTYIKAFSCTLMEAEHYFYYSLALAALCVNRKTHQERAYRKLIRRNQRKMAKWAGLCLENFRHKHDLVQAELMAGEGRFNDALAFYHAAVRGARENEYTNNEALACERTALFYQSAHAQEEAGLFMKKAYDCYGQWGAAAKQQDIEERYKLFLPVTQKAAPNDVSEHAGPSNITSKLLDLETVLQVSQAISGEIVLERLLQKTMHLSLVNAGAQRGFFILDREGRLTIEVSEDLDKKNQRITASLPLEECKELSTAIVHYAVRSLKPVILANAALTGPYTNDPYIASNRCKSVLCMPVLNKNNLLGILYMENNLNAAAFTDERLEILNIIASQSAISIENASLFHLATIDGLTGLYVHRYFQLLLDKEIERSRRYNRPFSLAMMDIDNFKHFNDTYGHQTGDEVLKGVARVLKDKIRSTDIAARYGGEEFVLIFPETDSEQAVTACEKIRKSVEDMQVPHGRDVLSITISLGAATFPVHADGKHYLIASADKAMYVAKRGGKNRVSVGEKINSMTGQ